MAVTLDTNFSRGASGAASVSMTVGPNANRFLLAFFCDWQATDTSTLTVNPSYDGIPLVRHPTYAYSPTGARVECWYLVAPAIGTHNFTYTVSGTCAVTVRSLYGVDQTTPLGGLVASVNGPNPPLSAAITAPSTDQLYEALSISSSSTVTPGSGWTLRDTIAPGNPKQLLTSATATGSSQQDAWTGTLADGRWADLVVHVVAAAAPSPSSAQGGLFWLWQDTAPVVLPPTPVPPTFGLEFFLGGAWVSLQNRLQAFESRWGREDEFSGTQPGTMRLWLLNDDGALDINWTGSPYYGQLDLNTPVRLSASWGGNNYALGYGYVTELVSEPTAMGATMEISTIDYTAQLAGHTITFSFEPNYEGIRIGDLLQYTGFPNNSILDPGELMLGPQVLEDVNVTAALDDVVRAGGGRFWFSPLGQARYLTWQHARSTPSVGSFGAGGTYPVQGVRPIYNGAGLYNQARTTKTLGGQNAVQRMGFYGAPPIAGSFVYLTFREVTIIAYATDSAAALETKLEGMTSIGAGNVTVADTPGFGGGWPTGFYDVTFTGDLGNQQVELMTFVKGTNDYSALFELRIIDPGQINYLEINDAASQAKYGIHSYQLPDSTAVLFPDDLTRTAWLQRLVDEQAYPMTRASELILDPYLHPNLWARCLGTDVGAYLEITHDLPGSRGIVNIGYYVEGVIHQATFGGMPQWTTTWKISRGSHA